MKNGEDFDLPFFKLWVKDFLVDTMHWTDEEIGAYFRLLLHQWMHGEVPADKRRRDRICDSLKKSWPMLKAKFPPGPDGRLQNVRLERERDDVVMTLLSRKRGGIKSAIKQGRKVTQQQAELVTEGVAELPPELPPKVVTVHSSESRVQKKRVQKGDISLEEFEGWWSAYPRKVAKKKCRDKWKTLVDRPAIEEMLDKLQKQMTYDRQWREGFIPNPLTYLNGERWDDDIDKRQTEEEREAAKRHTENMRALGIQ